MRMREIMNLVETPPATKPDVFPVLPMPDDFAPWSERIIYLGAILANEMVGSDRAWNKRTGLRRAIKVIEYVGGRGGYTNNAWLEAARDYIKKTPKLPF